MIKVKISISVGSDKEVLQTQKLVLGSDYLPLTFFNQDATWFGLWTYLHNIMNERMMLHYIKDMIKENFDQFFHGPPLILAEQLSYLNLGFLPKLSADF